jgi:hypothetical protein
MAEPVTTPITADLVRGARELEPTARGVRPHRLPAAVAARGAGPEVLAAEAQPSGVRLVFRTRATTVALDTLATRRVVPGLPPRGGGVYDLVVDGRVTARAAATGGNTLHLDPLTFATTLEEGPVGAVVFPDLPAGSKVVEIWLPHGETAELVALRTDAPVEPVAPRGRVWCHHGSSISQGSDAAGPTDTWPAVAARTAGVELVNLGLSGNAMLDPFTARAMRDTPADVLSVKIGINLVNGDVMRVRAFAPAVHGFLDVLREGHPDAPLLVVGPLHCAIHEDTPGPGAVDPVALAAGRLGFRATGTPGDPTRLTLRVIRAELARVVADRADPRLHLLDGLALYGEADAAELPLPDALHPDTAAHRRIGERFAALALAPGAPLGLTP